MTGAWANVARKEAQAEEEVQAQAPESRSSQGLQTLVVDSNALIGGINIFSGLHYELCTIKEVVSEIRDEKTRERISALPVSLAVLDPSPECIAKVVEFARATGDLHVLSDTDIKVIALARTLEVQTYGDAHLRTTPPPLVHRSDKKNNEKDLPGWGSNVPNPEEWDAIQDEDGENVDSHILGIQKLSFDPAEDKSETSYVDAVSKDDESETLSVDDVSKESLQKAERPEKVDASKGEHDDEDEGEWEKACGRSTRRRRKKRAARLAALEISSKLEESKATDEGSTVTDGLVEGDNKSQSNIQEEEQGDEVVEEHGDAHEEGDEGSVVESESETVTPVSASSIACLTTDFPMQNVILQMGLRLFTPTGLQVRELHRWVLRCHACCHVTREVDRLFCPKCGNGGTLNRVSMTIGADGSLEWGSSRRRISIRGTRYSLPVPKGGRARGTSNLILREDQLPRRLLHPKAKKSTASPALDTILSFDDVLQPKEKLSHHNRVSRADVALQLSGRRNPNDLHFRRKK